MKNCCLKTSWTYFVIDRSGDLNEFAFGRRPTTNGRNIQLAITIEEQKPGYFINDSMKVHIFLKIRIVIGGDGNLDGFSLSAGHV
jgi:hypothetical protein